MLSPYRVLDLSDERGQLAGFVLAQLGADVIIIEPPDGGSSRAVGPYAGAVVDPDLNLRYWAFNRGKRSVVLDLSASEADRAALRVLVAGADVLIESGAFGKLTALGLGYADLAAINPSLVHASVSAFGLDGPKRDWAATDLTVCAASGALLLTGDEDRAPVLVPGRQAFAHAAAEAAAAVVAALYERGTSGRGQHIDVSAQQASALATQSAVLDWPNHAPARRREAAGAVVGGIQVQVLWPCSDGHVSVTFLFGSAFGPATARLMQTIWEEGHCDEATRDKDWSRYGELLRTGEESTREYQRVKDCVGAFCLAHTKAELLRLAVERSLLIAPLNSVDDVVELAQLRERDYWDVVDGVRFPGPFARSSPTPLRRLGAAPRLGAHTAEVLTEPARRPSAPRPVDPPPTARPLEGVKVLDLMWVIAGPSVTRVLSDLGATVVRVESSRRFDTARTLSPFKDGTNDPEGSCLFANMNAGKLGIALDLSLAQAREVARDLVRWADVVTDSFAPGTMATWGLDPAALSDLHPGIVVLSNCLFGQTGPLARLPGFGTMAAALAGFSALTGWPDRPPAGTAAYTDYVAPRFALAVLLAALDHRRRTGEGQHIDFAQLEAALHTLSPVILDYTVNGRVAERDGNRDPDLRPHTVVPSRGADRWVALACADDDQRRALAALTGGLDDDAISRWTATRDGDEVVRLLQSQGVAAHMVSDSADFTNDPQIVARNHLVTVRHPSIGEVTIEGPRFRLSRTSPRVTTPGPMLGQHTVHVLTELLGYGEDSVVDLVLSGALE